MKSMDKSRARFTVQDFPDWGSYADWLHYGGPEPAAMPSVSKFENMNLTLAEETFVEEVVRRHGTPEAVGALAQCEPTAVNRIVAGARFSDLNCMELAALRRFIIRAATSVTT